MAKRYALLRGKLSEYGYDQLYLAKKMNRSIAYVNTRLTGKASFSLNDAYKLLDMLQIPHDQIYLYFPKDGKAVESKQSRESPRFKLVAMN